MRFALLDIRWHYYKARTIKTGVLIHKQKTKQNKIAQTDLIFDQSAITQEMEKL